MKTLSVLSRLLPTQQVFAHCDVPCGIYDPKPAQIAAKTILTMVQKMKALEAPDCHVDPQIKLDYENSMTRMIWTKEEHGRILKHELSVLWADYFKEEHLKMFPKLHDTFWKTLKLVSYNKQHVDEEKAEELIKAVDEIADMFAKSKAASTAKK